MEKFLEISISHNSIELGSCNYVMLNPYSTDSTRDITFRNYVNKNITSLSYEEEIEVLVQYYNKYGVKLFLIQFTVILVRFDSFETNGDVNVCGHIITYRNDIYEQGIIDVFNLWQEKGVFDWWSLPGESIEKLNYITACSMWSGLSKKIPNQENYIINGDLIKDEYDFYYLLGVTFFGDRGYLGNCLDTLEDSLIESLDRKADKGIHTIVFKNLNKIKRILGSDYYIDIACLFNRYKFKVIEN